jgi:hypothetical protein
MIKSSAEIGCAFSREAFTSPSVVDPVDPQAMKISEMQQRRVARMVSECWA